MIGKSPVGKSVLELPDTEEMRDRFTKEVIEGILLVIVLRPHAGVANVAPRTRAPPKRCPKAGARRKQD
jgi:hypothetical protein